jgi:uroporphyrin-III C-methyltransferase
MKSIIVTQTPQRITPAFAPGSVWLVGAGPGDPGLLTLHAWRALQQADVVLYDALVAPEIMALAPQAVLEPAGKRAGSVRTPQLRINDRLIRLARQGLRVVRLKGGDPLIFGRGAEEALALAAAGIPFRIVPGISAGIGGSAAASIPLTHRGLGRSVTFATGHDSTGGLADIDWGKLSQGADVLVLYMALRQIGPIVRHLMAAGRQPNEGVALISDATRAGQQVKIATLATAETAAAGIPRGAATLIVVGPVVALRQHLAASQQVNRMTVSHQSTGETARVFA